MERLFIIGLMLLFSATATQAAPVKLTHLCSTPDGATGVSASYLAEVAARYNVATIQTSCGKTLTKTMRQVAEGKADITASPFILNFLMMKGLGPYAGLGKKKGAELADNLRVLYSYDIASFYLVAFESKGIDSWEKLSTSNKGIIISNFLNINNNNLNLVDYFDNYLLNLTNNTLNSYIKGVIKPKI